MHNTCSFNSFPYGMKNLKTFHSALYGDIQFSDFIVTYIDHPYFQRLKNLQQLGAASFVYPEAVQERFGHCLGVCHLTRKWLDRLISKQSFLQKQCSERQYDLIVLAGLYHDLGHGPFSHCFEYEFIPRKLKNIEEEIEFLEKNKDNKETKEKIENLKKTKESLRNFDHEKMSVKIFRKICQDIKKKCEEKIAFNKATIEQIDSDIKNLKISTKNEKIIKSKMSKLEKEKRAVESQIKRLKYFPITDEKEIEFVGDIITGKVPEDFNQKEAPTKNQIDKNNNKNISFIEDDENEDDNEDDNDENEDDENKNNNFKPFWMYEIVHCVESGMDVDKLDYLARDGMFTGVGQVKQDYKRIFNFSKVINGHISFNSKEVNNIYKVFETRYMMFKTVYSHRVVKAISLMLADALIKCDEIFKISESVYDVEKYCLLNDSIINEISHYKHRINLFNDNSKDTLSQNFKNYEDASKIIQNLQYRELYKFVGEVKVTNWEIISSKLSSNRKREIMENFESEEKVLKFLKEKNYKNYDNIKKEDFYLSNLAIDYGSKMANPLLNVKFFSNKRTRTGLKLDTTTSFNYNMEDINSMHITPKVFQEFFIRLFVVEQKNLPKIQKMWKFLNKNKYFENIEKGIEINKN